MVCTVMYSIIPGCLIWALLTLTHTSVEDIHKEEIIERIKNDRFL